MDKIEEIRGKHMEDIKGQTDAMAMSMRASDLFYKINFRFLIALGIILLISLLIPNIGVFWLASIMVYHQDLWVYGIFVCLIGWIFRSSVMNNFQIEIDNYSILIISFLIVIFCYFGHIFILSGYDLSRDEQMANFDASIFARGRLTWPLSPFWQAHAAALNLEFMLPVEKPIAWTSAYLPMNAALRAIVGSVADRNLTSPLLTAASLPLIWSIARCIWQEDRETSTVSALLLLGSSQYLINGMTAYAMTAHLLFNLLWLRLFLINKRWSDILAIFVAFIATGLHQPLFHPMFAGPFLILTLLNRCWLRAAIFAGGYALIGAFWLSWPIYIHGLVIGPESISAVAGVDYVSRLHQILSVTIANPTLTAANLLRFVTWQHILIVPLMVLGLRVARRDNFVAMLALSLALPIAVMAIILPYQGIGFGYRYLHGLLGNAVLLAVYGWRELKASHVELRPALLRATAAGFAVVLPLQMWMAYARYAPMARANAQIDASGADYVLIEEMNGPFVRDLVLNRPDLSNRPIRLVSEAIDDMPVLAERLCRPGVKVAFGTDAFYAPSWAYFGSKAKRSANAGLKISKRPFERAGCHAILLN